MYIHEKKIIYFDFFPLSAVNVRILQVCDEKLEKQLEKLFLRVLKAFFFCMCVG